MSETADLTSQLQHWLDLLRSGDLQARDRLIEQACSRLRTLAARMLRDYPKLRRWEETDDVFVQAVTKLHRSLADVQPDSVRRFYGLAATQVRRVLIDLARHYDGPEGVGAKHETAGLLADNSLPPLYERSDTTLEPSGLMEWTEFHELVETLPAEEKEVFDLLWYEGLSQEEAATVLGVTDRTVRRRWQSARVRLYEAHLGEQPPP